MRVVGHSACSVRSILRSHHLHHHGVQYKGPTRGRLAVRYAGFPYEHTADKL